MLNSEYLFKAKIIQIILGNVSIALSHSEGFQDQLILRKGGKGGKWFTVPYEDVSEAEIEQLAKNFDKEWEARVGQYL